MHEYYLKIVINSGFAHPRKYVYTASRLHVNIGFGNVVNRLCGETIEHIQQHFNAMLQVISIKYLKRFEEIIQMFYALYLICEST